MVPKTDKLFSCVLSLKFKPKLNLILNKLMDPKPALNKRTVECQILNDICQKHSDGIPSYEVLEISGEPHKTLFTIRCTFDVKQVVIIGEGKAYSKLKAKKKSAQNVIRQLREREIKIDNKKAGPVSVNKNLNEK